MPPSTVCATTASVGSRYSDEATRAPPVPTGTSSRLTGSFHPILVLHLLLLSSSLVSSSSSFVGASSSRRRRLSRWKTSGTSSSSSKSKLAWWSSAMMLLHRTTRTTKHFYTRTTPRETPPSFSSLSSSSSRDTKTNKTKTKRKQKDENRRLWRVVVKRRAGKRFFGRGGGPERAQNALGFGDASPPNVFCPFNERPPLLGFSASYTTLNNTYRKKKAFEEAAGKDMTHTLRHASLRRPHEEEEKDKNVFYQ